MIFEQIAVLWPLAIAVVDVIAAAGCTVHIVLRKRDVRAAIGWTGVVWLAPLVGSAAYVGFGINRIQRRAASLDIRDCRYSNATVELTAEDHRIGAEFLEEHPQMGGLAHLLRQLTGSIPLPGNSVTPLLNGDETYPEMLKAIDEAKRSVTLLTYVFDSDWIGERFLESLKNAHERGVLVRVLIDDVGARYSRPTMTSRLRKAGVPVAAFLPTRIPRLIQYANLRNHRKILVVDGRIGFTGGTNIRGGHCLKANPRFPVQCMHFRIEGPVVAHLQQAFVVDWNFAAGEVLVGDDWFPPLERSGNVWALGISDGPDEDFEKLTDTLIGALSISRKTVRLATPYFLPDAGLIQALNSAALRGVDVRIYLPQGNNVPIVSWASVPHIEQLLEKGCRVFFVAPPFDHTKLFVVDEAWSLIGSTNWDPRSLRLNFEFNVACFSESLGDQLMEAMDRKEEFAREVTLDDINGRSFPVQLRDGLARLFSPYL